jgi:protoheme IX farnesyltransferase
MKYAGYHIALSYIEVLKPRESSLLTVIGVCSAFIAGGGYLQRDEFILILLTILLASMGANGLTNYLDRHIDSRMKRTRNRALPSKRIFPAEKALFPVISLVICGLVLAWQLHFLSFLADLIGTVVAIIWRKRWTCVFPQGILASCAPVLMGWFAVDPSFSWKLFMLCVLIAVWLPIHLWSVMIIHREDYLEAGISYFPLNRNVNSVVRIILLLSILLYATSIAIYFVFSFNLIYLVLTNILGCTLLYTSFRLVISVSSGRAWKLYKLSAFPYLGLTFLSMCIAVS